MPAPQLACTFTGGPLDGRRIPVPADQGSYHHEDGGAHHVYYRRSHPSAWEDPDSRRVVHPSPPYFDHQPHLTAERAA